MLVQFFAILSELKLATELELKVWHFNHTFLGDLFFDWIQNLKLISYLIEFLVISRRIVG